MARLRYHRLIFQILEKRGWKRVKSKQEFSERTIYIDDRFRVGNRIFKSSHELFFYSRYKLGSSSTTLIYKIIEYVE